MVKPRRDEPIENLNPAGMKPSPENVELAKEVIAKLDGMRLVWAVSLGAWEKVLGLSTEMTPPADPVPDVVRMPRGVARPKPNGVVTKPLAVIQGSMADMVYTIVREATRPMSFRDVEDELRKRGWGDKLSQSNRPHYGAVQRLRESGHIVSHNGRFATPAVLERFKADVAAGRVKDECAPQLKNRWAEPILAYLENKPEGAITQDIIAHLRTLPKFAENQAKYSDTWIYNIVGKLANRDKLIEPCGKAGKAIIYRLRKFGNRTTNDREVTVNTYGKTDRDEDGLTLADILNGKTTH